ncbi:RHS repeat-associated core domain-containing protein [Pseudomonas amygdali pv. lachrymans str. M301315]|uniref:YD repeat-containing protein n=5 Tax=Pseudomonas syringae group TaxID=136849 RepID=A0ABR5KZK7_PSEAV|nr:RHS repeat-associated core domain-containing protein [Pseudomonas amygdali pv. lachrymans]AXH57667.1 RHS repeat-associated core domain-containing protein [Pseudomonas amygdali pv. lachrymans str. M301315]QOI03560.1 RHS repeat-associated core domain-containing protein [Pseudomonas savastanoi]KPB99666.1 YD repeat-containing protein [Pseudomonas amygdali pv. lachrymans]KPC21395.1 YD repeat-containing protein [Pseudomonas amygdali pv. lachrymans]
MIGYSNLDCGACVAMTNTPETRCVLCRYRYDALDRIAVVDPEVQEVVSRFYQKNRLTVEIQGATRRRVFHGDDRLLAEYETDGSITRTNLLSTDRQISVLHALSSEERQPLAYSPYGHRLPGGPFSGFNGERADPVTGHYLLGNGYRAFNPVLMRFNRPDSLSPFGRGGLNAYVYCQGDPVNRSDSGGHVGVHILFLDKLPDLALDRIFRHLSFKNMAAVSGASNTLNERGAGLIASQLNKRFVDASNPDVLSDLRSAIENEPGFLPSVFKSADFKVQFEKVTANASQKTSDRIKEAWRAEQSFSDKFTGKPNTGYDDFKKALAIKLNEHEGSPETLLNIKRDEARRKTLMRAWYTQLNLKGEMEQQVAKIRSLLNSP